jgi:hypothetical protein
MANMGEGLRLLGAAALLIGGFAIALVMRGILLRLLVLGVAIVAAAYVAGMLPSIQLPF